MIIRRARIGDEQNIAKLIIHTWKDAYRGIVPDDFLAALTTDKHEQLFKEQIKKAEATIFVLENDSGNIIGMVSGGKDRSNAFDCEIVALYILPEYQKKGYGRQLFKNIIKDHRANNHHSMIIWTFKENKDQKFYEKLGSSIQKTGMHRIGDKEIPIIGYIWDDMNKIIL